MNTRRDFIRNTALAALAGFAATSIAPVSLEIPQQLSAAEWLRINSEWVRGWISNAKHTEGLPITQQFQTSVIASGIGLVAKPEERLEGVIKTALDRIVEMLVLASVFGVQYKLDSDSFRYMDGFIAQAGRYPKPTDRVILHIAEPMRFEEWTCEPTYRGVFTCAVSRLEILT